MHVLYSYAKSPELPKARLFVQPTSRKNDSEPHGCDPGAGIPNLADVGSLKHYLALSKVEQEASEKPSSALARYIATRQFQERDNYKEMHQSITLFVASRPYNSRN